MENEPIFLPGNLSTPATEAVDALFYLGSYSPGHSRERLVPDGKVSLIIELDDQERFVYEPDTGEAVTSCKGSWFSGMHSGYMFFSVPPNTELVAVRFNPGGAHAFIGTSMEHFSNQVLPASRVFGPDVDTLRADLKSASDPHARLRRLESWLEDRFDPEQLPEIAVLDAIRSIQNEPTVGTIQHVIQQIPMSRKHFIAQFRRYVGLSPKIFQRVLRFAEVMPLLQEEKRVNWSQLALDCGYYDQSHFIKDFKRFSGYNPRQFVEEGHDRSNFFPSEH